MRVLILVRAINRCVWSKYFLNFKPHNSILKKKYNLKHCTISFIRLFASVSNFREREPEAQQHRLKLFKISIVITKSKNSLIKSDSSQIILKSCEINSKRMLGQNLEWLLKMRVHNSPIIKILNFKMCAWNNLETTESIRVFFLNCLGEDVYKTIVL